MARRKGRGSLDSAQSVNDEQESKSAATRARILDAAAHVLSVRGYAGLRLTDVAARADIQAPAIYYYYPSREALIEEVMWSGVADMRNQVSAALDALPDGTAPVDRLLTAVATHLQHALEISHFATAAIRNAGQVPLDIRKRQIREEERYGEIWRKLINDLAREGQLRPELDPYIAQMLILGALNWTVEWWDPRRSSVEAVIANAQSIIKHGITTVE